MIIDNIKPLVKGYAKISHIIGGVVYYIVTSEDGKRYQFPIDMNDKADVGENANFLCEYDKPIYLMRWIRRANENNILEELV